MRIGNGFDLHRLEPGRPFMLGGVRLDWHSGPIGHSDGDVLLHALTDALLGAAGMGDIGEWFPPTDEAYRDADSAKLLAKVLEAIGSQGWRIENIDTTIMLEQPKLKDAKPLIRARLAELAALPPDCISVKAKTMEGLGAIGRSEAVAAWVNVLLARE